jgi:hypothetical protein
MATYAGPATLTLPNGAEIEVSAALHSFMDNNLRAWRGTLTVDLPASLWDGVGQTCTIRTMDGDTGEVVLTRFQPGATSEVAEVTGSGLGPF